MELKKKLQNKKVDEMLNEEKIELKRLFYK
jgi:hypothetical protein